MLKMFIQRPVLSLVISLLILLVGALGFFSLPITQFPDIVPPSVAVTAKYTGANAEVCAKAVATPIERSINGVPGMTSMSTVCTNNGVTLTIVNFKVGTDPDVAAVAVQNRVTTILDELPEEVVKAGVTSEKEVNSMLMYLNIYSTDSTVDEKFVFNFADINIIRELKRIDGVGFAEIMGAKDFSMRIWMKPDRMVTYKVSPQEIIDAIREQNIEAAPGKSGESSGRSVQPLQYILRYTGKFSDSTEYGNIPIRANADGSILRLKDVAEIELGALDYHMKSKTDGRPSASIMIKQRPGSNAREVIQNIKKRMEELKITSFPPGMTFNVNYDVSRFLDASIAEVIKTLIEAFILVSIVVFLFLQDWRSTLIPALAVPVSLIGTFAFLNMLGFSINLLTLFALVLAIGIVVDNAIVVVEAVHAKMESTGMEPMEATIESMKEIGGAIVAITLVMSAVFVPVAFMTGPVGIFYRQFSLTLAISIVISGINALTLTPALCAILLKNNHGHASNNLLGRFFKGFNAKYDGLAGRYNQLIEKIAGRKVITYTMLGVFFAATWGINSILPGGFIPTEDQGVLYINVDSPPGATVERTEKVLDEVYATISKHPAVESISTLAGYSLLTEAAGASYGMGMVNLKPWDQREEKIFDLIPVFQEATAGISDGKIEFFPPPTVPGFGNAAGFEFRLLDRTGTGNLNQLAEVADRFLVELNNRPEIGNAFTTFNPNFPQYLIRFDYDMAAKKGISVNTAMEGLQAFFGSYYASNFIKFGVMYKVMVQALPEFREKPEDLLSLQIKNSRGDMVPYGSFLKLERVYGPDQLTRFNMFNAVMINGESRQGFSSGDAIRAIEETATKVLPKGFAYEWSGMTREEVLSGNQTIFIFAICLVFVYLILSAQYESFRLPIPVILSLPTGIFGSYFMLKILGLENNIYAQVALVMLIGLLGKNAILIVEFANQRLQEGATVLQAAIDGAASRLRPILMTSLAFIAGLIPLMIANGAGALGNRSIGTAAAGGMLFGTLFGVILIPGLFAIFARMPKKRTTPHDATH